MRQLPGAVHQRLLRAVRDAIAADSVLGRWMDAEAGARPPLVIEDFATTPWASLTFSGNRHSLAVRLCGPALEVEHAYDRLQAVLTEPEIALPGHFLAEIGVSDVDAELDLEGNMTMAVSIEALTIEE